ncbi:hypothetical protein ACH5RR_032492 [Cinchona calisaya]|uniref:Reverse transcriptase zinc-binding domain-containing protein n=1 Tax=Cinchona calisaya TaxID=153742 RepID=A0ABD2YI89_9GENT
MKYVNQSRREVSVWLQVWSKALLLKHIWNIFKKKDSLCIAWIHVIKLKNQSFWAAKIPNDRFWFWRKLLQLRELAKPFIRTAVGNGKRISLWHDHWHLKRPLLDAYGSAIIDNFCSITDESWKP